MHFEIESTLVSEAYASAETPWLVAVDSGSVFVLSWACVCVRAYMRRARDGWVGGRVRACCYQPELLWICAGWVESPVPSICVIRLSRTTPPKPGRNAPVMDSEGRAASLVVSS